MKKFAAVLLLVFLITGTASSREYNLNFAIFNKSGTKIMRVYLSPSWKEDFDRRGDLVTKSNGDPTTVANEDYEIINLDNANYDYRQSALWDMYIVCADGREKMLRKINLSRVAAVVVYRNLSYETFTAEEIQNML